MPIKKEVVEEQKLQAPTSISSLSQREKEIIGWEYFYFAKIDAKMQLIGSKPKADSAL